MEELLNRKRDLTEEIERIKEHLDLLQQELVSVKNNIHRMTQQNKTLKDYTDEFGSREKWSDDIGVRDGRIDSASGIMRYKRTKNKRTNKRKYKKTKNKRRK